MPCSRKGVSNFVIRRVVPFQVAFRRFNRFVNGGGFHAARAPNAAIAATPCAPHYRAFHFLNVDRIAYTLSHVIQFLNFFGCHRAHLLRFNFENFEPKSGNVQQLNWPPVRRLNIPEDLVPHANRTTDRRAVCLMDCQMAEIGRVLLNRRTANPFRHQR